MLAVPSVVPIDRDKSVIHRYLRRFVVTVYDSHREEETVEALSVICEDVLWDHAGLGDPTMQAAAGVVPAQISTHVPSDWKAQVAFDAGQGEDAVHPKFARVVDTP